MFDTILGFPDLDPAVLASLLIDRSVSEMSHGDGKTKRKRDFVLYWDRLFLGTAALLRTLSSHKVFEPCMLLLILWRLNSTSQMVLQGLNLN